MDNNKESNKFQKNIDEKMIRHKISSIRDDLSKKNLSEKKVNILTAGLSTKDELFNRQKKLKRITNDKSARRITKDVASDLIESEYNKIFNKDK